MSKSLDLNSKCNRRVLLFQFQPNKYWSLLFRSIFFLRLAYRALITFPMSWTRFTSLLYHQQNPFFLPLHFLCTSSREGMHGDGDWSEVGFVGEVAYA